MAEQVPDLPPLEAPDYIEDADFNPWEAVESEKIPAAGAQEAVQASAQAPAILAQEVPAPLPLKPQEAPAAVRIRRHWVPIRPPLRVPPRHRALARAGGGPRGPRPGACVHPSRRPAPSLCRGGTRAPAPRCAPPAPRSRPLSAELRAELARLASLSRTAPAWLAELAKIDPLAKLRADVQRWRETFLPRTLENLAGPRSSFDRLREEMARATAPMDRIREEMARLRSPLARINDLLARRP